MSTTRPIDDALAALIADPSLADTFRATFDAELTGCVVDWPRTGSRDELARFLRRTDVLIELTRSPAREPFELGLALHTESATRAVERVLGSPASSALPSRMGAPSDAECGVLAYAVARVCVTAAAGFIVRDVRVDPLADAWPEQTVLWPLSLRTSFGSLDGVLLMSRALAASSLALHPLELLLRDRCASDFTPAVGDAWVSDHWTLTDTTEGLTGPVVLSTSGTTTELTASLARHQLTVTGVGPTVASDQLTLVLAQRALSFAELADLAGGIPCALPPLGEAPVQLRRGAAKIAEGELIVHRGALGIHITAR